MNLFLNKDVPLISKELLNPWRLPKVSGLEVFQLEGLQLILPGFVIIGMIVVVRGFVKMLEGI